MQNNDRFMILVFTTAALAIVVLIAGWTMNVHTLSEMFKEGIEAGVATEGSFMLILRLVGLIFLPLGGIIGYF
jgi:hypothetical protein